MQMSRVFEHGSFRQASLEMYRWVWPWSFKLFVYFSREVIFCQNFGKLFKIFEYNYTKSYELKFLFSAECHLICHTKCVSSLPSMCGVSKVLVSKFAMYSNRSSLILDDGTLAIDVTDGHHVPKIEGWLKYPRKWVVFVLFLYSYHQLTHITQTGNSKITLTYLHQQNSVWPNT